MSNKCHKTDLERSANRNKTVMKGSAVNRTFQASIVAVALSAGWITPAHASAAQQPSVQQQFAEMQARLDKLDRRVDTLEGELDKERARADAAEARARKAEAEAAAARAELSKAPPPAPAPTVSAKPATEIAWKGAPELSTKDGWSFKPRGRIHLDAGSVSTPGALSNPNLGGNLRVRRARLGAEGTMPGGIGYKLEMDFANSAVGLADAFLSYSPGNAPVIVRIGNFETLNGLEQVTSSNNNSYLERASFGDAFLNSRRLGAAVAFKNKSGTVRAELGVFAGHSLDSSLDNDGWIGAARLVFAPEALGGQLHFGVNYQFRDFASNISGGTSTGTNMPSINQLGRYRARPNSQLTDVRFVDTGSFAAKGDSILGVEGAAIFPGLYLAGEAQWVKTRSYRPGDLASGVDAFSGGNSAVVTFTNPGFFGMYGEVGYFLTGETRGYKRGDGTWSRTRVNKPWSKGGLGAFQLSARYEYLDLDDDALIAGPTNNFTTGTSALAALPTRLGRGGTQSSYMLGLNWYASDYVRLLINYGRIEVRGGPLAGTVDPLSADPVNQREYGVNVLQTRLQFEF